MISIKNINKPLIWIVLVGLLLRLYRYTHESIWLDESISIYVAQQPLLEVITFIDPTPPLFYILLHLWISISASEAWLKLLPIFISLGTIVATYFVAKEMYSKKTGLIAAILIALSPIHIFYAQELRAYSLLFFLTTSLIYFYLTYDKSNRNKVWYYLFFIGTAYTHIYGIFVLLAIQAHRLIQKKKLFFSDKKWFITHSILTVLSLPWLYKVYYMVTIGEAGWIPFPRITDVAITYIQSITGPGFFLLSYFVITLAIIIHIYSIITTKNKRIVSLWILLPILIPFLLSLILQPFFFYRYALLVSVPLLLLLANGLSHIPYKKIISTCLYLSLICLIILQAHSIEKDPWNQIEVTYPVGFIASYEAFPYIYLHEQECFAQPTIDEVYICAAQRGIFAISEQYPQTQNISTYVLSKHYLTQESTQLAKQYVPDNWTRTEYLTNTDVGIFTNYAPSTTIFVVQP